MPKCDGCPREIVKPVHYKIEIKSQRVCMQRFWAFCGERCRDRWWAAPSSEDLGVVDNTETLRAKVREAKKDPEHCAKVLRRHAYRRGDKTFCVHRTAEEKVDLAEAKAEPDVELEVELEAKADPKRMRNGLRKLAKMGNEEVDPESLDDASHEKAVEEMVVAEISDDEFALAPTPQLFCCHGPNRHRSDSDLEVIIHKHNGFDAQRRPIQSATKAKFECPCRINSWWRQPER